jgi:hypothetical protein
MKRHRILPDIDAGSVLWKTLTTRSKLASLSLAVKFHFDLRPKNEDSVSPAGR